MVKYIDALTEFIGKRGGILILGLLLIGAGGFSFDSSGFLNVNCQVGCSGGGGGGGGNVNLTQVNGQSISLGNATMANSLPVTIASDQTNIPFNLAQIGGTGYSLGNTTMSSSAPVTIASNQTAFPVTPQISTTPFPVSTSPPCTNGAHGGCEIEGTPNGTPINTYDLYPDAQATPSQSGTTPVTVELATPPPTGESIYVYYCGVASTGTNTTETAKCVYASKTSTACDGTQWNLGGQTITVPATGGNNTQIFGGSTQANSASGPSMAARPFKVPSGWEVCGVPIGTTASAFNWVFFYHVQ